MPGRAWVARVSAESTLRRPPTVLRGPSGTLEAFQRTSGYVPAAFARFPAFLRGNRRFLPAHHLTFPPPSSQMFAQLRNALARNASVFQTARNASSGANGKAWAVDLMASEAGISKKQIVCMHHLDGNCAKARAGSYERGCNKIHFTSAASIKCKLGDSCSSGSCSYLH